MQRKKKAILRLTSSLLLVAFSLSEISYAAPDGFINSAVSANPLQSLLEDPTRFEAPLDFVNLKEIYSTKNEARSMNQDGSGKVIILIEDAHSNLSGQQNLAGALEAIMSKYFRGTNTIVAGSQSLFLVLSEGGSEDCSLTSIKKIAPPDVWKRLAKSYLVQGKISGEEYLNLVSDHPMKIIGLEDIQLYLKSVQNYAELAEQREATLDYLKRIQNALDQLKKKLYPQELLNYEARFKKGISTETNFKALLELAADKGIDLSEYASVVQLIDLELKEKQIDFNIANLEQAVLFEEISSRGGAGDLKDQLARVGQMKDSKTAQFAYFQNTLRIAQEKKILLSKYPNYVQYGEYLRAFSAVDLDKFLEEFTQAEDKVYKALLKGEDENLTRSIDRYTRLLETAYQIQMTTKDFNLFKVNEPDFATPAYLAFINRKLAELGYFQDWIPYENLLEQGKKALEAFYDSVSQRDYAFLKNAERILREENQKLAVLISGGYHTPHLKKLFADKGYSIVVLTPIVTSETNQQKYEKLLLSSVKKEIKKIEVGGEEAKDERRRGELDRDLIRAKKKTEGVRVALMDEELRLTANNPTGSRLGQLLIDAGATPRQVEDLVSGLRAGRSAVSVETKIEGEKPALSSVSVSEALKGLVRSSELLKFIPETMLGADGAIHSEEDLIRALSEGSQGVFTVEDFIKLKGLNVKAGFGLGIRRGEVRESFAAIFDLITWGPGYKAFGLKWEEMYDNVKFMEYIARSNRPVVFFVPDNMYSHQASVWLNTRDEMKWLLNHPDKLKNVYFVLGAYDYIRAPGRTLTAAEMRETVREKVLSEFDIENRNNTRQQIEKNIENYLWRRDVQTPVESILEEKGKDSLGPGARLATVQTNNLNAFQIALAETMHEVSLMISGQSPISLPDERLAIWMSPLWWITAQYTVMGMPLGLVPAAWAVALSLFYTSYLFLFHYSRVTGKAGKLFVKAARPEPLEKGTGARLTEPKVPLEGSVVDEVVYFGTTSSAQFDVPSVAFASTERVGFHGYGIYFSTLEGAKPYAYDLGKKSGKLYPLRVAIKNPVPLDVLEMLKFRHGSDQRKITEESIALGYDGVVLRHALTGKILEGVVFSDKQIYSVGKPIFINERGDIREEGARLARPLAPKTLIPDQLESLVRKLRDRLGEVPYTSPKFNQSAFRDLVEPIEMIEIAQGIKDPKDFFSYRFKEKSFKIHPYKTSVIRPKFQYASSDRRWLEQLEKLVRDLSGQVKDRPVILKITGRPGSGKSFLAFLLGTNGLAAAGIQSDQVRVMQTDKYLMMSINKRVLPNVSAIQQRYREAQEQGVRLFIIEGVQAAEVFGERKLATAPDLSIFIKTDDSRVLWDRIASREPMERQQDAEYFFRSALVRGIEQHYTLDPQEIEADIVIETTDNRMEALFGKQEGARLAKPSQTTPFNRNYEALLELNEQIKKLHETIPLAVRNLTQGRPFILSEPVRFASPAFYKDPNQYFLFGIEDSGQKIGALFVIMDANGRILGMGIENPEFERQKVLYFAQLEPSDHLWAVFETYLSQNPAAKTEIKTEEQSHIYLPWVMNQEEADDLLVQAQRDAIFRHVIGSPEMPVKDMCLRGAFVVSPQFIGQAFQDEVLQMIFRRTGVMALDLLSLEHEMFHFVLDRQMEKPEMAKRIRQWASLKHYTFYRMIGDKRHGLYAFLTTNEHIYQEMLTHLLEGYLDRSGIALSGRTSDVLLAEDVELFVEMGILPGWAAPSVLGFTGEYIDNKYFQALELRAKEEGETIVRSSTQFWEKMDQVIAELNRIVPKINDRLWEENVPQEFITRGHEWTPAKEDHPLTFGQIALFSAIIDMTYPAWEKSGQEAAVWKKVIVRLQNDLLQSFGGWQEGGQTRSMKTFLELNSTLPINLRLMIDADTRKWIQGLVTDVLKGFGADAAHITEGDTARLISQGVSEAKKDLPPASGARLAGNDTVGPEPNSGILEMFRRNLIAESTVKRWIAHRESADVLTMEEMSKWLQGSRPLSAERLSIEDGQEIVLYQLALSGGESAYILVKRYDQKVVSVSMMLGTLEDRGQSHIFYQIPEIYHSLIQDDLVRKMSDSKTVLKDEGKLWKVARPFAEFDRDFEKFIEGLSENELIKGFVLSMVQRGLYPQVRGQYILLPLRMMGGAGFYDPHSRGIYTADRLGHVSAKSSPLVVHEFLHYLFENYLTGESRAKVDAYFKEIHPELMEWLKHNPLEKTRRYAERLHATEGLAYYLGTMALDGEIETGAYPQDGGTLKLTLKIQDLDFFVKLGLISEELKAQIMLRIEKKGKLKILEQQSGLGANAFIQTGARIADLDSAARELSWLVLSSEVPLDQRKKEALTVTQGMNLADRRLVKEKFLELTFPSMTRSDNSAIKEVFFSVVETLDGRSNADGARLAELEDIFTPKVMTLIVTGLLSLSELSAEAGGIDRSISIERGKEIQTELMNAGYYKGAIDGLVGDNTRRALKAFQIGEGLKDDGILGPKTKEALDRYRVAGPAAVDRSKVSVEPDEIEIIRIVISAEVPIRQAVRASDIQDPQLRRFFEVFEYLEDGYERFGSILFPGKSRAEVTSFLLAVRANQIRDFFFGKGLRETKWEATVQKIGGGAEGKAASYFQIEAPTANDAILNSFFKKPKEVQEELITNLDLDSQAPFRAYLALVRSDPSAAETKIKSLMKSEDRKDVQMLMANIVLDRKLSMYRLEIPSLHNYAESTLVYRTTWAPAGWAIVKNRALEDFFFAELLAELRDQSAKDANRTLVEFKKNLRLYDRVERYVYSKIQSARNREREGRRSVAEGYLREAFDFLAAIKRDYASGKMKGVKNAEQRIGWAEAQLLKEMSRIKAGIIQDQWPQAGQVRILQQSGKDPLEIIAEWFNRLPDERSRGLAPKAPGGARLATERIDEDRLEQWQRDVMELKGLLDEGREAEAVSLARKWYEVSRSMSPTDQDMGAFWMARALRMFDRDDEARPFLREIMDRGDTTSHFFQYAASRDSAWVSSHFPTEKAALEKNSAEPGSLTDGLIRELGFVALTDSYFGKVLYRNAKPIPELDDTRDRLTEEIAKQVNLMGNAKFNRWINFSAYALAFEDVYLLMDSSQEQGKQVTGFVRSSNGAQNASSKLKWIVARSEDHLSGRGMLLMAEFFKQLRRDGALKVEWETLPAAISFYRNFLRKHFAVFGVKNYSIDPKYWEVRVHFTPAVESKVLSKDQSDEELTATAGIPLRASGTFDQYEDKKNPGSRERFFLLARKPDAGVPQISVLPTQQQSGSRLGTVIVKHADAERAVIHELETIGIHRIHDWPTGPGVLEGYTLKVLTALHSVYPATWDQLLAHLAKAVKEKSIDGIAIHGDLNVWAMIWYLGSASPENYASEEEVPLRTLQFNPPGDGARLADGQKRLVTTPAPDAVEAQVLENVRQYLASPESASLRDFLQNKRVVPYKRIEAYVYDRLLGSILDYYSQWTVANHAETFLQTGERLEDALASNGYFHSKDSFPDFIRYFTGKESETTPPLLGKAELMARQVIASFEQGNLKSGTIRVPLWGRISYHSLKVISYVVIASIFSGVVGGIMDLLWNKMGVASAGVAGMVGVFSYMATRLINRSAQMAVKPFRENIMHWTRSVQQNPYREAERKFIESKRDTLVGPPDMLSGGRLATERPADTRQNFFYQFRSRLLLWLTMLLPILGPITNYGQTIKAQSVEKTGTGSSSPVEVSINRISDQTIRITMTGPANAQALDLYQSESLGGPWQLLATKLATNGKANHEVATTTGVQRFYRAGVAESWRDTDRDGTEDSYDLFLMGKYGDQSSLADVALPIRNLNLRINAADFFGNRIRDRKFPATIEEEDAAGEASKTWSVNYEHKGNYRLENLPVPPVNFEFKKGDMFPGMDSYESPDEHLLYNKLRGISQDMFFQIREFVAYQTFLALGVPTTRIVAFANVHIIPENPEEGAGLPAQAPYMFIQREEERRDESPFMKEFGISEIFEASDFMQIKLSEERSGNQVNVLDGDMFSRGFRILNQDGTHTDRVFPLDIASTLKYQIIMDFLEADDHTPFSNEDYAKRSGSGKWAVVPFDFDWSMRRYNWPSSSLLREIDQSYSLTLEEKAFAKSEAHRLAKEIFDNPENLHKILELIDRFPFEYAGKNLLKDYVRLRFYISASYYGSSEFADQTGQTFIPYQNERLFLGEASRLLESRQSFSADLKFLVGGLRHLLKNGISAAAITPAEVLQVFDKDEETTPRPDGSKIVTITQTDADGKSSVILKVEFDARGNPVEAVRNPNNRPEVYRELRWDADLGNFTLGPVEKALGVVGRKMLIGKKVGARLTMEQDKGSAEEIKKEEGALLREAIVSSEILELLQEPRLAEKWNIRRDDHPDTQFDTFYRLLQARSKGAFTMDTFVKEYGLRVSGGYSLGLNRGRNLALARVLGLVTWPTAYDELSVSESEEGHTVKLMDRITGQKDHPVVFFVPDILATYREAWRESTITKSEILWLLNNPDRMKNVYLVFNAELYFPKGENPNAVEYKQQMAGLEAKAIRDLKARYPRADIPRRVRNNIKKADEREALASVSREKGARLSPIPKPEDELSFADIFGARLSDQTIVTREQVLDAANDQKAVELLARAYRTQFKTLKGKYYNFQFIAEAMLKRNAFIQFKEEVRRDAEGNFLKDIEGRNITKVYVEFYSSKDLLTGEFNSIDRIELTDAVEAFVMKEKAGLVEEISPRQALSEVYSVAQPATETGSLHRLGLKTLAQIRDGKKPLLLSMTIGASASAEEKQFILRVKQVIQSTVQGISFEFRDREGQLLQEMSDSVMGEITVVHIDELNAQSELSEWLLSSQVKGGESIVPIEGRSDDKNQVDIAPYSGVFIAAILVGWLDSIEGNDLAVQFFTRLTGVKFDQGRFSRMKHPDGKKKDQFKDMPIRRIAKVAIDQFIVYTRLALKAIGAAA